MAQVSIRIDNDVKKRADALFAELGLNMTTAFNIFVRQALRQGGLPFEVTVDPFYSESNQAHLRRAIAQLDAGEGKFHDLIEADDV
jgi:DNA-damage-inducible protein J